MKRLEELDPQELDAATIRVLAGRKQDVEREQAIVKSILMSPELWEWVNIITDNMPNVPPPESSITPHALWVLSALAIGLEIGYELRADVTLPRSTGEGSSARAEGPESTASPESKKGAAPPSDWLPKAVALEMTPERKERMLAASHRVADALHGLPPPEIFMVITFVTQALEEKFQVRMAGMVVVPEGGHDA